MYKPIVLLIILGLISPIFTAKDAGIFDKKTRDPSNTEESQDFWDFNPNADAGSDNIPSGPKKSGSKKSTMNELEQILKTMETTLSKMGATTTTERFLIESPATMIAEEELILNGQNNENVLSEEQEEQGEEASFPVIPDESTNNTQEESSETSEEEQNTDEAPVETTPTENESETENGGEQVPVEEEEALPDEVPVEESQAVPTAVLDAQNSEAGTATLSGSLEFDMQFSTFNQEAGKETFLRGIASTLGLDQSLVRVTNIREGSVIFDFEITLPAGDQQTKDTSLSTLESFATRLEDGATSDSLGIFENAPVLNFERKITVFAPTSEVAVPTKDNNSLTTVLVVLSGIVILGAVGFFVYKNKQSEGEMKAAAKEPKYKMSAKSEAERLDLESKGTASRTSLGEVVGDKLKLFSNSPPSDLDF